MPQGPLPGFGGPGLLVRTRSGDRRFSSQTAVRIGRDPALEVVADDPVVSRLHAVVEPRPDGWYFVDRSTAGTFVDGERIGTLRLEEEPVTVVLGHPTAGYELELVPVVSAAEASKAIVGKKRRRTLAVVGAAVLVLALIGGGIAAAVVLGGDDSPKDSAGDTLPSTGTGTLSKANLERAKLASVLLLAVTDGQVTANGSGSIIDSSGLILTNSHVAQPTKQPSNTEGADPDYLLVALTSEEDDTPAKPTYRARPIVTDGIVDLSVVKIYADADGNQLDSGSLDLPDPIPLGESTDTSTGDEITALGYPALSASDLQGAFETRELTVTRGIVSTLIQDPLIGEDGSWIDSDIRIGSGNSGGGSINDAGELLGINTAVRTANTTQGHAGEFTSGSALIRPIDYAKPLIEAAKQGGNPDYVSPYADNVPSPEDMQNVGDFKAFGWVLDPDQGSCSNTSTVEDPEVLSVQPGQVIYAQYRISGLPDGAPISFSLLDFSNADKQLAEPVQVNWSSDDDGKCLTVGFTAPKRVRGVNAPLAVDGTYVLDNPLTFQ